MCVQVYVYMCVCMYANVRGQHMYLLQLFSTLFFGTGSLVEPGTHLLG